MNTLYADAITAMGPILGPVALSLFGGVFFSVLMCAVVDWGRHPRGGDVPKTPRPQPDPDAQVVWHLALFMLYLLLAPGVLILGRCLMCC